MKIAIPTRNGIIDDHFGHCELYTLLTIDDQKAIVKSEHMPSPQGCGCKSNIASVLRQHGVSVMLAGNMGAGALNVLSSHGITVYRGCSGAVLDVAESFLAGNIEDSGEGCRQHEVHHGENAHHGHQHDSAHQCGNQ